MNYELNDESNFCIEWDGRHNQTGYAAMRVKEGGEWRDYILHRLLTNAPKDLEVDHLCRNHGCIRLDHLEVVTPIENMRRHSEFARSKPCRKCGSRDWYYYGQLQKVGVQRRICRVCTDRYRKENWPRILQQQLKNERERTKRLQEKGLTSRGTPRNRGSR